MPYINISNARLVPILSQEGCEIRVAIHPDALVDTLPPEPPNPRIMLVQEILSNLQRNYYVAARVYSRSIENDDTHEAAGCEICITLPDSKHATEDYHEMLMCLWRALKQAQIPLVYRKVAEGTKLLGERGFPTPFSITSAQPDIQHPISNVRFTEADLKAYEIKLKVKHLVRQDLAEYKKYRADTIRQIQEDINTIQQLLVDVSDDSSTDAVSVDIDEKRAAITNAFDEYYLGDAFAKVDKIDWSQYIPGFSLEMIHELVERNPLVMQSVYQKIVSLDRDDKSFNDFQSTCKPYILHKNFGCQIAYEKLVKFYKQIKVMQIRAISNRNPAVTSDVLLKFENLYFELEREMIRHDKCALSETPYELILDDFTWLAQKVNKGQKYNAEDMQLFCVNLESKLAGKPMSKVTKAAICGVIGAVIGVAIGFTIGAAATFWAGGIGSLPVAIAGGLVGMTVAQGLLVGGAAVAGGASVAALSGGFGLFSAKRNSEKHQKYKLDVQALRSSEANICQAIAKIVDVEKAASMEQSYRTSPETKGLYEARMATLSRQAPLVLDATAAESSSDAARAAAPEYTSEEISDAARAAAPEYTSEEISDAAHAAAPVNPPANALNPLLVPTAQTVEFAALSPSGSDVEPRNVETVAVAATLQSASNVEQAQTREVQVVELEGPAPAVSVVEQPLPETVELWRYCQRGYSQ